MMNASLSAPLPPEAHHFSQPPDIAINSAIFAPIRVIIRSSEFTRDGKTVADEMFGILCLMRVMQNSQSGRAFLQTHGQTLVPEFNRANYFASLSRARRLTCMQKLAVAFREEYLSIYWSAEH